MAVKHVTLFLSLAALLFTSSAFAAPNQKGQKAGKKKGQHAAQVTDPAKLEAKKLKAQNKKNKKAGNKLAADGSIIKKEKGKKGQASKESAEG